MKRIILSKLDFLNSHYYNSTRIDSWKFNQFKSVLEDKVDTDTEEEAVFKCLLYIYQDFIDYSFAFDVSECVVILRNVLANNPRTRTWYRKIRIVEKYCKGLMITDKEIINPLLDAMELLIEKNLDRMIGKAWTKLDRPIKIENPIKKQLEEIEVNKEFGNYDSSNQG